MTRRVLGALALLLCTVGGVAVAHELGEPSITLSLREGGFVGVRVQVPWSAMLRRRFFPDMVTLSGDSGAKHLIGEHADLVCEVEMAGAAAITDIDTPEALAAWRARSTS